MTAQEFLTSRLNASGLTAADAAELGIKASEKPPSQIAKAGPGFVIPYFDKKGKRLATFRYRRDLDRLTGFERLKTSPKYLQPEGTPPEIYIPPFKGQKWPVRLLDVEEDIFITEGELKSAAAVRNKLTCIGLGGVWSWRSKRDNKFILPALKEIAWEKRNVFIVFDSDAVSNPQVALAEQALCEVLRELKAMPRVVRLPTLPGQTKTGLDDFLLSEGVDAFHDLCDETEADPLTMGIDALNAEVTIVKNLHEIYEHETGRFIPLSKFSKLSFANRYIKQTVNNKEVKIKIADAWLGSTRRAVVDDLVFRPAGPRLIHADVRSGGELKHLTALNTWKDWGCGSKKGDVSLFTEFLDYLCKKEGPEARRWLEQWFAFPVQYPGTKLYSAVVIWSRETGTGKSFLGDIVGGIYGKGYTAVTHSMLEKNFNGWAENKQFIMGSEITGNDSRRFADQLKDMITRSKMHVERKYVDSYEIDDLANYYFTSNHSDAFFLEDKDRRFFVIDASFPPLKREFYEKCDAYFKRGPGLAALRYHFEHLDMTGFSPIDKALPTAAKQHMLESGRSNVAQWADDFRNNRSKAVERTPKGLEHLPKSALFTSAEVFKAYQIANDDDRRTTSVTMGRALTNAGFQKVLDYQINISADIKEYVWADPTTHPELFNMPGSKIAALFKQERAHKSSQQERKF